MDARATELLRALLDGPTRGLTDLVPAPVGEPCWASKCVEPEPARALAAAGAALLTAGRTWLRHDRFRLPAGADVAEQPTVDKVAEDDHRRVAAIDQHLAAFSYLQAWRSMTVSERVAECFEPLVVHLLDPEKTRCPQSGLHPQDGGKGAKRHRLRRRRALYSFASS